MKPSPLQPPTFRPDLPNYPVHIQAVRVTGGTIPGPSGYQSASLLGPTLYLAVTEQLDPTTLLPRDREPCLVLDLNNQLGNGPTLSPGYYLGRLAGTYQSLPIYEIGFELSSTSDICGLRLTTQSGTPISVVDRTIQATVYLTFYKGNHIVLYNGIRDVVYYLSAELSCALSGIASDTNYDLFAWDDSGSIRLTRGPAWSSDTSRGAGVGTTELEYRNGRLVNKQAISAGPQAQRGTYVGSVRGSGSGTTEDSRVARFLWNMYHRIPRELHVDAAGIATSWAYNSNTWRYADGNSDNIVRVLAGQQGPLACLHVAIGCETNLAAGIVGIGRDTTNPSNDSISSPSVLVSGTTASSGASAFLSVPTPIGYHFYSWLEACSNANTVTFLAGALSREEVGMNGWYEC